MPKTPGYALGYIVRARFEGQRELFLVVVMSEFSFERHGMSMLNIWICGAARHLVFLPFCVKSMPRSDSQAKSPRDRSGMFNLQTSSMTGHPNKLMGVPRIERRSSWASTALITTSYV